MTASILIVDSEQLLRDGLRQILSEQTDFTVVGDVGDGVAAVEFVSENPVDVAIVEGQLPGLGIEAVRRISAESPKTACVVLSRLQGPLQVQQALLAGAAAFVPKDSPSGDLITAVREASVGRSYLAPGVADQVVSVLRSSADGSVAPTTRLTGRQHEVLGLIVDGLSTKEVAAELGISIKTAQTHRAKIMSKVGVRKASALVRYAIREGFVSA